MADPALIDRVHDEIVERIDEEMRRQPFAGELANLGLPLETFAREYGPPLSAVLLDIAVARWGAATEDVLARHRDRAVVILARRMLWSLIDTLGALRPITPPASQG